MTMICDACQIYEVWTLVFLFNSLLFYILFSLFGSRIRVRVISWLYCYASVTSDDTVTVTSHEVTEKDVEGLEKIMLYNMYNAY